MNLKNVKCLHQCKYRCVINAARCKIDLEALDCSNYVYNTWDENEDQPLISNSEYTISLLAKFATHFIASILRWKINLWSFKYRNTISTKSLWKMWRDNSFVQWKELIIINIWLIQRYVLILKYYLRDISILYSKGI